MFQCACAAVALGAAVVMRPWLARAGYRLEHETAPQRRYGLWWIVPTCAIVAFFTSAQRQPGYAMVAALVATWLVLISAIDAHVHRLPDRWTGAGAALTPVGLAIAAAAAGRAWPLERALLSEAILPSIYLVLAILGRGGMGLGDVKLAAGIGAVLGYRSWQDLATATTLAFVLGGFFSLGLMVTSWIRRRPRPVEVAFGPFMAAGAVVTLAVFRL